MTGRGGASLPGGRAESVGERSEGLIPSPAIKKDCKMSYVLSVGR